jgi:hypothetical protein
MLMRQVSVATLLLLSEIVLRAQTLTLPVLPGETVVRARETDRSTFSIGLRMSEEFDDNTLSNNLDKQASAITLFEPHIGWTLANSRAQWMLDYRPGLSKSYPISIYDSRSQLFDTSLQLKPAKRLRLRLRESFLSSKNIFDQLQQSELTSGSRVLDRPNNPVLAASRETNQQAGADVTYTLTPRTAIGASGAFYAVTYKSAVDAQELGNATSIGTHGFLSHRSSKHNLIGLNYNLQNLITQHGRSRALVHGILYTDALVIRPDMSFSFFVGPQRSVLTGAPAASSVEFAPARPADWSWSGGANYIWSGTRTSLSAGMSRRISDGAGVQGIVQLSSATAEVRRQLTKQWKGQLLVSADRNKPLGVDSTALSYVSFAGGLSRALSPRLSLEFQYWRIHQTASAAKATSFLADHNRVSMSIAYDFEGPIQQ